MKKCKNNLVLNLDDSSVISELQAYGLQPKQSIDTGTGVVQTSVPFVATCDPETFAVFLEFRAGALCGGTPVATLTGTFQITFNDTTAIANNSVFTVPFDVEDVIFQSGNANIVVDNPTNNQFRVVSAAALTEPIVITFRVPNPGCGHFEATASVTEISPLASGWELGETTGDTLTYH